jgi:hypothetical protein
MSMAYAPGYFSICDHMPDIIGERVRLKCELFSHGIYNTRPISGLSEDESYLEGEQHASLHQHSATAY